MNERPYIYIYIYISYTCLWEWWLAKASSNCLAHSTRRGLLLTPSSTCGPHTITNKGQFRYTHFGHLPSARQTCVVGVDSHDP